MQFRQIFTSSWFVPGLSLGLGFLIIGIGFYGWLAARGRPPRFRGLAPAGTYYRIVPDFSCAGQRRILGRLEIRAEGFRVWTTNPFDCSEIQRTLPETEEIEVSFDRAHIGYGDGIFIQLPAAPHLMESTPRVPELWCRPHSAEAPPMDLYTLNEYESGTLRLQRAEKDPRDGSFRVESPVSLPVQRKLIGSRLSYEAEQIKVEAQLTSNAGDGKISGHAKIKLQDQFLDMNIVCRTSYKQISFCPPGYLEVPAHPDFLVQPVCISREEIGKVNAREPAMKTCRALGAGFDLAREEEWLAALRSRTPLGWNSGGAAEWTKDGESVGTMGFRCVFHVKPEGEETIFPRLYSPPAMSDVGLPVEAGVRFVSSKRGFVKGVRFYRHVADPAGYTVHLWDAKGRVLRTATGAGEKVPGWQVIRFNEPVAIEAGETFVASYYTTVGRVSLESRGLNRERGRGMSLKALVSGGGMLSNGGFPAQAGSAGENYGVDVIFE